MVKEVPKVPTKDPELALTVKETIRKVAARGYDYTGRKIYTLAELDWTSTYGYGTPEYGAQPWSPAGVFMVEGSPCRGVIIARRNWEGSWLVDFVNDHIRARFTIPHRRIGELAEAEEKGGNNVGANIVSIPDCRMVVPKSGRWEDNGNNGGAGKTSAPDCPGPEGGGRESP